MQIKESLLHLGLKDNVGTHLLSGEWRPVECVLGVTHIPPKGRLGHHQSDGGIAEPSPLPLVNAPPYSPF